MICIMLTKSAETKKMVRTVFRSCTCVGTKTMVRIMLAKSVGTKKMVRTALNVCLTAQRPDAVPTRTLWVPMLPVQSR